MRLVYTNEVETKTPNVMILPIKGDFQGFVKLAKEYDDLALHLYQAYETIRHRGSRGSKRAKGIAEIIQYGSYQVSFAASLDLVDWKGFAEPGDDAMIKTMHQHYPPVDGYGFVVAKLLPVDKPKRHPIVFDVGFAKGNERRQMILPTYHIHGGPSTKKDENEDEEANWDHLITLVNCQASEVESKCFPSSARTLKVVQNAENERELALFYRLLTEWKVGSDIRCMTMTRIVGHGENVDVWIQPPTIDHRSCDLCNQDIIEFPYYSCVQCKDVDFCHRCFTPEAAGKFTNHQDHNKDHQYHTLKQDGDRAKVIRVEKTITKEATVSKEAKEAKEAKATTVKEGKSKMACNYCQGVMPQGSEFAVCSTCPLVIRCGGCRSAAIGPTLLAVGHNETHNMIAMTNWQR